MHENLHCVAWLGHGKHLWPFKLGPLSHTHDVRRGPPVGAPSSVQGQARRGAAEKSAYKTKAPVEMDAVIDESVDPVRPRRDRARGVCGRK